MNRIIRRSAPVLAAAVAAGLGFAPGTAAAAPQASAQDCLDTLVRARFAATGPEGVVVPSSGARVTPFAHLVDDARCAGITASVGISRRDGTGMRNQLARISRVNGLITVYVDLPVGVRDAGSWAIRQVAVAKHGRVAVRGFNPATSAGVQVRRASVLTGRAVSGWTIDARTLRLPLHGYLKAFASTGPQVSLPAGQRVLIQVRQHGTNRPYWTVGVSTTSASGYWRTTVRLGDGPPQDVRAVYPTPYRTIASDYTWLGIVRVAP